MHQGDWLKPDPCISNISIFVCNLTLHRHFLPLSVLNGNEKFFNGLCHKDRFIQHLGHLIEVTPVRILSHQDFCQWFIQVASSSPW